MEESFKENVEKLDWKRIFEERYIIDRSVDRKVDSIISSQVGRMEKFQQVLSYGYAAKDALLRHMNTNDATEDVLARRYTPPLRYAKRNGDAHSWIRYYSSALLGCLHRTKATREWVQLLRGKDVPLERALAAFDMFVLHDREGDFDDVGCYHKPEGIC